MGASLFCLANEQHPQRMAAESPRQGQAPYVCTCEATIASLRTLASIKPHDRVYETRHGELYTAGKGTGLYHLAFGEGRHATLERVNSVIEGTRLHLPYIPPDDIEAAARGVRQLESSFTSGNDVGMVMGKVYVAEQALLEMANCLREKEKIAADLDGADNAAVGQVCGEDFSTAASEKKNCERPVDSPRPEREQGQRQLAAGTRTTGARMSVTRERSAAAEGGHERGCAGRRFTVVKEEPREQSCSRERRGQEGGTREEHQRGNEEQHQGKEEEHEWSDDEAERSEEEMEEEELHTNRAGGDGLRNRQSITSGNVYEPACVVVASPKLLFSDDFSESVVVRAVDPFCTHAQFLDTVCVPLSRKRTRRSKKHKRVQK